MWAVKVDEIRVHAVRNGASWWYWYRRNAEPAGRIIIEKTALPGDVVLVTCDTEEQATWLARYMHTMGLPTCAAKAVHRR